MAYTIYQSDGTSWTVADNAIDDSFYNAIGGGGIGGTPAPQGIQLVGRNTVDYGTAIAQNFLQLTENFCSNAATPPSDTTSLQGQLWFAQTSALAGSLYVRVTKQGVAGGIGNWQQLVTNDGSVAYASNLLKPGPNTILYQTATNVTGVISAPSTANTFLEWDGSAFVWTTVAAATNASNILGGVAKEILYQTGPNTTSFITAPTTANTALLWNGSSFIWSPAGTGTVTSVTGAGSVSGLTLSGTVTTSGNITLGGTLTLTSGQVTTALGYTPPTPTGTGASGTWGINISGNAVTATTAITQASATSNTTIATTAFVHAVALTSSPTATAYWSYWNVLASGGAGVVNYQSAVSGAVGINSYSAGTLRVTNAGTYYVVGTVAAGYGGGLSGANETIHLYHNGVNTGPAAYWTENNNTGEIGTLTVAGIITCAANDSIQIYYTPGGGQTYGGYGSFAGFRIA